MLWPNQELEINPTLDTSGRDFPTTAGETFQAAWSRNNLYGQNYNGEHDRFSALDDYLAKVKAMTGEDIGQQLDYGGGDMTQPDSYALLRQANDKVNQLKQKNPALELEPLSREEFEQNGVAKRRKADADYEAVMARPRGPGATLAAAAGGIAAGTADPINLASMALAPEASLGIMKNFVQWGAFGLGVGGLEEALQAPYQEEVHPGYLASGAPLANVAQGALVAGVGGAAFRGVANIWDRMRTGAWPQSIKDAGNVVSSHANIAASNVYPGVEGSIAHPQALSKTIDDVLHRRPVDVSDHITPELEARAGQAPIEAARTQAQAAALEAARARVPPAEAAPELPFERTAAEAQAAAAREPLDAGVQNIARNGSYDMPADEAARISDKLMAATPDEAQNLIRDLQISPRQVADAPARLERPAQETPALVSPVDVPSPDFHTAQRADLDRELVPSPAVGYPISVDEKGNVSYQSIEGALNEVDGYKTAADQIAACAAPAAEGAPA